MTVTRGPVTEIVAAQHGMGINKNGGIYIPGKAYDLRKKTEVAIAYQNAKFARGGGRPNLRALARSCGVSLHTIMNIEKELKSAGRVLNPSEINHHHIGSIGPGSKSVGETGAFVLYLLYSEEPSKSLASYVEWLEILLGVKVSRSTVSRVFKKAFPFSSGFFRPNLVPYDKFRPANLQKAMEYLTFIAMVDPKRIKFGDEKLLKGQELYNRNVRRNPFTGEIPPVFTGPDFRNTYAITGFCGIDRRSPALFFSIHEGNNDSTQFALDLEAAIAANFLHPGDILVLDNAAYHTGGENTNLHSWLWTTHGIFLMFLPARCPELNPIEQVWKSLVKRLKSFPLGVVRKIRKHGVAIAAASILSFLTHEEVEKMYKHSGLIVH